MSDVTRILSQISSGDRHASDELLPLVYDELRRLAAARMASERPDHTLQATALVHEAYLRLVDTKDAQCWDSRGHFFAAAAEAMRRILINSAKSRATIKRGGDAERVEMEALEMVAHTGTDPDLLLDVDEGLEILASESPELAEFVKLRLFAGLSVPEAGELLGMSRTTAYETWRFARSWFATRQRR